MTYTQIEGIATGITIYDSSKSALLVNTCLMRNKMIERDRSKILNYIFNKLVEEIKIDRTNIFQKE